MKILGMGVVFVLISLSVGYLWVSKPQRGNKVLESWETSNDGFKIGVTTLAEENGGFVPGAYYVFSSARAYSSIWQEVMTFRHDDPVPIPKQQVQFVNEMIGYLFMGWRYAVTTDGGLNWHIWSAEKDLLGWECCNYKLIQNVRLDADGTGTMFLRPIPGRGGEVPKLYTSDYGRHWNQK